MSQFTLSANVRSAAEQGKGASRRLRRTAQIPGIVYGGHQDPLTISVEFRQLIKCLENDAFFSSIINLDVDGKIENVVIKALQRHPAKNSPTHVDFMRVSADELITVHVPLHFKNQDTSIGVKAGGVLHLIANEVEVRTLPKDLPEELVVDLAAVDVGGVIRLSDIPLPNGVTITALHLGEDHDQPVASITAPAGGAQDTTDASE